MIEVIEYDAGNVGSLFRCLERLNIPYKSVNAQDPPSGKAPLILPGVGAFGATMASLNHKGLSHRIQDLVREGTPFLGICVGMQVLFEESEESPGEKGLGLIPGQILRYNAKKVPQVGWNFIGSTRQEVPSSGYVYFVNSYYPQPADRTITLYESDYEGPFCAAIQTGSMTAFQFHPEKSGAFGHELIRRWAHDV